MYSNDSLINHILVEVNYLLEVTSNSNFETVFNNQTLNRAICRSLEIIGEASKKLEPDFKLQNPQIDWRSMAKTRDKIIHDYFGVDYDIVWDIINNELPDLKIELERILSRK